MRIISPLYISKKVLALSLIGFSILSPVNVLAVDQPVSAPITIPVPIPVSQAPEMVYPKNGQTLDLEGAYMFKVQPVASASGYLFGLFQDNVMVYENYRDAKQLSTNGEFTLSQSNPAHAKFKAGPVKVMIRAYVRNQWTDARTINIALKPRVSLPIPTPIPGISVNTDSVVVTLDRSNADAQSRLVFGPGFTIKSNGASGWAIKYSAPTSGQGFYESSGGIRPGSTNTIRTYINTNKSDGIYVGQATVQYFQDNKWQDGPSVKYTITLTDGNPTPTSVGIGTTAVPAVKQIKKPALPIWRRFFNRFFYR